MKLKITRQKFGLLFFVSLAVVFFIPFLIYTNYNFAKKNDSLRLPDENKNKTISTAVTLNLGKIASAASANKDSKITPTITTEAKPAGFCVSVPVIFYHHIEPIAQAKTEGHAGLTVDVNNFDNQMKYLKDHGYRAITAQELVQALINRSNSLGKAVVVSVDDGYVDAYNFAFPVAKKYGVILNLMIPTGLLNNGDYMSWGQLKEMVNSGLAQAYDHTWSHFTLPKGDENKIQMEIMTAKNQLEQNLGSTAKILTYPYGSFDQKVIDVLQKNGFVGAFSTTAGFWQCDSFIMTLHRNRIGNAPLSAYGL